MRQTVSESGHAATCTMTRRGSCASLAFIGLLLVVFASVWKQGHEERDTA